MTELLPRERYRRDPAFRALVDIMRNEIDRCNYTPTELREAVILAAQLHAESTIPAPSFYPRIGLYPRIGE